MLPYDYHDPDSEPHRLSARRCLTRSTRAGAACSLQCRWSALKKVFAAAFSLTCAPARICTESATRDTRRSCERAVRASRRDSRYLRGVRRRLVRMEFDGEPSMRDFDIETQRRPARESLRAHSAPSYRPDGGRGRAPRGAYTQGYGAGASDEERAKLTPPAERVGKRDILFWSHGALRGGRARGHSAHFGCQRLVVVVHAEDIESALAH